jgi:hypothetical protein
VGRHPRGWFCYTEDGLIICSYLCWRSSGVVPNFYFVLRKARR